MKKAALPPKDAAGAPTSPEETTPTKGKKKPLTDLACKKATCPPNRNRFRLYDTGGLYLEVLPTGRKGWYLKLRVRENNKLAEKRMSLGAYRSPDETPKPGKHSLQEARRLRDEQRLVHQSGKNPIEARRETKQVATATSVTFGDVAEEWQLSKSEQWSDSYKKKVQRLVGNFLLPRLGKRIMEKIAPNELDAAVQAILDNSPKKRRESANETLRIAQQIWNYALAKYATEDTFKRGNIATPLIKTGVLPAPEVTHNKAVTKPEHLAPILRAIRSYKGASPVVPTALQLVPILFVRSGNIQMMRWEEIDFDKAIWTIPRAKMKVKDRDFDFICPLPRQARCVSASRRASDSPGNPPPRGSLRPLPNRPDRN